MIKFQMGPSVLGNRSVKTWARAVQTNRNRLGPKFGHGSGSLEKDSDECWCPHLSPKPGQIRSDNPAGAVRAGHLPS